MSFLGSLNPTPVLEQLPAEEKEKLEAAQLQYHQRYQREQALRLAFELTRGTGIAGDPQAIIRVARDLLAFCDNG